MKQYNMSKKLIYWRDMEEITELGWKLESQSQQGQEPGQLPEDA